MMYRGPVIGDAVLVAQYLNVPVQIAVEPEPEQLPEEVLLVLLTLQRTPPRPPIVVVPHPSAPGKDGRANEYEDISIIAMKIYRTFLIM